MEKLRKLWGFDVEYIDHYGLDDFLGIAGDQGKDRCRKCYEMRLDKTAETARQMRLDGFTTSLLVSPYQKFDILVDTGREIARRHSIPFYAEDFRVGYRGSIPLSRELGLYRQKYCGCIFSEAERAVSARKKERNA